MAAAFILSRWLPHHYFHVCSGVVEKISPSIDYSKEGYIPFCRGWNSSPED